VLEREYVGVINDTDFTCSGSFSAGADGSRNHVMWRIHCFMQFLTDSKSSACSFIHKNISCLNIRIITGLWSGPAVVILRCSQVSRCFYSHSGLVQKNMVNPQ
jgi:hypothetical protein